MLQSFAMTFVAVSLRIGLPVAPLLGHEGLDGYQIQPFLSWIGKLAVLKVWRRRSRLGIRNPASKATWAPSGAVAISTVPSL